MPPGDAKPISQFNQETQEVIRAIVEDNVNDYHYSIQRDNAKEWTIWFCYQAKQRWLAFCYYTVEDHGNHYRVRGDGGHDRWHTIRKGD